MSEHEWRAWLDRQLLVARASAVIGVRAGLDPEYRSSEGLDQLAREIEAEYGRWLAFTPAERRELVDSARHGWSAGWGKHR